MFDTYEASLDQGSPVELYEFAMGSKAWRYTSHAQDLDIALVPWRAVTISRGQIEAANELNRSSVTVTMARDLEVPELFRTAPPSEVVTLTIYGLHVNDVDAERITIWKGRVLNVMWRGLSAELTAEPIYTSLRRTGLRRSYQRQCPHMLYSTACGVNQFTYEVGGSVGSVSGAALVVDAAAGQADGYFDGGMLTAELTPGVVTRRTIRSQVGNQVTLTLAIPDLVAGQAVKLYPGCDHTIATCAGKFSNQLNYGGWPYIPSKNPFGGGPVF